MQLAVNYSHALAALCRKGKVTVDCFKCPPWPDMVAAARCEGPTYVHFSFRVGPGQGYVVERDDPFTAWDDVEALLRQTETPLVNVHLAPHREEHPDIPPDSDDPADAARLTARMVRDVSAVTTRFGAENVIAENVYFTDNYGFRAAVLPAVIRDVIEATDCGLLLDLSHARLAAEGLGMDPRAYIAALPVERVREIHVTGIQYAGDAWVARWRQGGVEKRVIAQYGYRMMDHLPMTGADWDFFAWAMAQVHDGAWATPWTVAFEYGGVGALFEATTDADVLAAQVPRLYTMLNGRR